MGTEVRFIAHAGVAVTYQGKTLLLDPWFTDSTREKPVIESVIGHSTIDFQIPKTPLAIQDFSPHIILVSHFHTHHASYHDIHTLVDQTKELTFGFPDLGPQNEDVKKRFEKFSHITFEPQSAGSSFSAPPFKVTALPHVGPGHAAWLVETPNAKILHISDARLNRAHNLRTPDSLWDEFRWLKPHILFLSAGGNSLRVAHENKRDILESGTLSPIEGARITAQIDPQVVSLTGMYNHSIWRNREEYIRPAPIIEEEFHWAVNWLAPRTKCIFAHPGHHYWIGNPSETPKGADTVIAV